MFIERITDPPSIDRDQIAAILARGRTPAVQFSAPVYTPEMLARLDAFCAEFGARLQVRFYGHYREDFDAAVLAQLPHVRWLLVDCLTRIRNEEQLWHLPALEHLSFGVFEFDRPDFLGGFALERLKSLWLSETRKRNFDLAPLARCEGLTELLIEGHTKNIAALADLPALTTLHLRALPKRQDLAFVGGIAGLRNLTLILGGREAIDELAHPALERLHIIRVRGLASLGDLGRFPALRRLQVEDQLQLREIALDGVRLHELRLINCKNLAHIDGLQQQAELLQFVAHRTALDLDALLQGDWPPATRFVGLYCGSEKWNDAATRELERRGLREPVNFAEGVV